LDYLGRYQDALTWGKRALEIRLEVPKENDPTSAQKLAHSYNNVGSAYGALGDHRKALEYQTKALTILKDTLPPDHLDLAISYGHVGRTYGALGDHKRALEYSLKALAIREKVLPPEHPDLAVSYNDVGVAYDNLGDHKRALEYKLKDLAICEKVLPPEHPDFATAYNNIAYTYHKLGDLQTAARCMRRAAESISRSSLPETHPDRINYPKRADELEREAEKVQQMEQAIRAAMKGFGPTPPFPFEKK